MGTRLRTTLVVVLAIALFAWFLRNANLAGVAAQIRRAHLDLLIFSMGFIAATYVSRTVRWMYLLEPLGRVGFVSTFRATVIGFATIALLPARVGDVLRPYLLARKEDLNAASAFATVVMERVLDLIAVLALLALYVFALGGRESVPRRLLAGVETTAVLAGGIGVALFVLMWILATHPDRVGHFVLKAGGWLPARVAERLSSLARTFSQGFAVAREARALTMAMLWSFPVWIGIAGSVWLVARAFDIAIPFAGAFLLQSLLVIGVAVPTPGGIGGYHAMYQVGVTTFFGASNDAAVGAAIVAHALAFFPVAIVGIVFMAQDGLSLGGLTRLAGVARQEERKLP